MKAPVKFVPETEQTTFTGPCAAKKRRRSLIKLDVFIYTISSIRTTHTLIKECAHLLLFAAAPQAQVEMFHGPNAPDPHL